MSLFPGDTTKQMCVAPPMIWLRAVSGLRPGSARRFVTELGLAAVAATQLWHHTFVDAQLADLPSLALGRSCN